MPNSSGPIARTRLELTQSDALILAMERTLSAPPKPALGGDRRVRLTTYYNGACPVCRTEMRHYKRISRSHSLDLAWCDVSRDRFISKRLGLDREAIKRRLHAIDKEGRLFVGVAAFAEIWRELPGYRWAAWLVSRPVIRPLANLVYDNALAPALYGLNRLRERRQVQTGAGSGT